MALVDFDFCKRGEGGRFVESGGILFEGGSLPMRRVFVCGAPPQINQRFFGIDHKFVIALSLDW
jgi:hypothetical protein